MNQNGSCEVKLHLTRVGEARHLADFRKCQWDWFQSAVLPGLRTFANALGLELVLRKKQAKPLSSLARS